MTKQLHVSLVAIPEASISTLHGLYDVLVGFEMFQGLDDTLPRSPPFRVEIVSEGDQPIQLASGLTTHIHRAVSDLETTDIVIVPSVVVGSAGWKRGRYPMLLSFLERVHNQGAVLCSACSGMFLLGETGLFDGRPATIHWNYAPQFHALFPDVILHPEQVVVVAGERGELVTSGAAMSWHDLALYLVARFVGRTAAQSMAKFFALQWHRDGLGPYIVFEGQKEHGDGVILAAQNWLATHYSIADPVAGVVARSEISERTFMRRFQAATGLTPLAYVQRLRIEEAKRRLERTDESIEKIGWHVGYEDPAFFRRLFKRITHVTPGQYRRQFHVPETS